MVAVGKSTAIDILQKKRKDLQLYAEPVKQWQSYQFPIPGPPWKVDLLAEYYEHPGPESFLNLQVSPKFHGIRLSVFERCFFPSPKDGGWNLFDPEIFVLFW
jgi:hypothetical protein